MLFGTSQRADYQAHILLKVEKAEEVKDGLLISGVVYRFRFTDYW